MRALGACVLLAAACAGAAQQPAGRAQTLAPASLAAFFDCLQRDGGTIVAAHRGGPAPGYAENALATMAHTLAQAPVAMEIDVRRARDGALVLMHDETVDRTTTGSGRVDALTGAQIAALTLEDEGGAALAGQHPPTLRAALDWAAGRTILELDVKRGVAIDEVVRAVQAAGAQQRAIIITYTLADTIAAHRADPSLMLSAPVESIADIARLQRAGVDLARVLAWTGTSEPNAALNIALEARGIESAFGTLGAPGASWDGRFARGEATGYAAFAETGIELIASDRPIEAQRALGAMHEAAMRCAEE